LRTRQPCFPQTILMAITVAICSSPFAVSHARADGTVTITQAKALAGSISPRDTPGYPITLKSGVNYQLGSDLKVLSGRNAFAHSYRGTIDLAGFTIDGGGTAESLIVSPGWPFKIRNGTITGFSRIVIDGGSLINGGGTNFLSITDVTFTGNGGVARVNNLDDDLGAVFEFRNNIVVSNGFGILCGIYCHIEGNIFANNRGVAVALYSGTVLGNTIISNGTGILGSSASPAGFGNNMIAGNGIQVTNTIPLVPNACRPAC